MPLRPVQRCCLWRRPLSAEACCAELPRRRLATAGVNRCWRGQKDEVLQSEIFGPLVTVSLLTQEAGTCPRELCPARA
jgi:hypothetical protein